MVSEKENKMLEDEKKNLEVEKKQENQCQLYKPG